MALTYDPDAACRALADADPRLGAVIDAVGPFTLQPRTMTSPFEALLRSIVYQQLSGKAAATIHGRLTALFPSGTPTPDALLALPDDALRGAGLSRAKAAAAHDLARRTLDGTVPDLEALQALEDDAVVERLTAVRGVGRWTVEMLLLFRLGRPDVYPVTDLGIRKGVARLHALDALPTPREMPEYGAAWRPYRSVASWYLWRLVDLPDDYSPSRSASSA